MSDKRLMSIKFKGIDQTYVIPTVIADDANNDGNVVVKNYPSEAYAQHSVDKANPHSVTAEQVGAAPAGYGLGAHAIFVNNLDDAKINGWYQFSGSVTIDSATLWHPRIFVIAGDELNLTQELYPISAYGVSTNSKLRRRCHDGAWQPWEWENPPMVADVEYRTTERIDSKAVFKKKNNSGQILYRLDGETEWKTQAPLMGAAPAYAKVDATLTTAGWYKVGTIQPAGGDFTTACRIAIGGNYSYDSPPSAIIDVTSDYDSLNAVVTVPALKNKQVTKVGFIRSEMEIFDVYVYYTHSSRNNVYIAVDMLKGTFTKANLESASVSESNMAKVVEPSVSSFAPSGYGLGSSDSRAVNTPDDALLNGFYRVSSDNYSGDGTFIDYRLGWCSLFVTRRTDKIFQTAKHDSTEWIRYSSDNGSTWQPWEWVNPPMALGVEYRTTERWNGKVVYTKLVNCGALPDNGQKSFAYCDAVNAVAIQMYGAAIKGTESISIPYKLIVIEAYEYELVIRTTENMGNWNGYVVVKYTKD